MTKGVGLARRAADQMRSAPMWPALEALAPTLVYDGIDHGGHDVREGAAERVGDVA